MANPATVAHIQERWRSLAGTDLIRAETYLQAAWEVLTAEVPGLDDRLTAETVSEALVVHVLCEMTLRVLRNPEGKLEETIDDYRYRRDRLVSSGVLYVTPEEVSYLTPSGYKRAKTVRLVAHGDT